MKCRHCNNHLTHVFLDLGFSPPSNAYLTEENLSAPETYYPLKLYACEICWLVQTADYTDANDLFNDEYAYFSSTSTSWLQHAAKFSTHIIHELSLDSNSMVVEVASNDGYLLKNFIAHNIPCLGVEPTAGTAVAAEKLGVPVVREFFGERLATELSANGKTADLIIGNNVYAHVPDINDFTKGLKVLLKEGGTITLEFPHLMNLIDQNQFDTVYHEHFSYLSLQTVIKIFDSENLRIYKVENLPTHGGSLRVFGCHKNDYTKKNDASVQSTLTQEELAGLSNISTYTKFQEKADRVKNDFLSFLIEQKNSGKIVAGYGAAAKGSTLLNYAGIKNDLIAFVCDAAESKQGKYLPGSHIPIHHPDSLKVKRPDWVVIFPWNIADEVMTQQSFISSWNAKFVTAVPELKIHHQEEYTERQGARK